MDELKNIIAVFIKKETGSIDNGTLINRSAIPGSIMVHRMYASFSKAGYHVADYSRINTYGELLGALGLEGGAAITPQPNVAEAEPSSTGIGIDMESVDNLPMADDFREHEFYVNNFSADEIAYCLLKPNPYESFAGLFSVKEALGKADNSLRSLPFNQIIVRHDSNGKPLFDNYALSISHTQQFSIAVAVAQLQLQAPVISANNQTTVAKQNNIKPLLIAVIIALLLVIIYLLYKR